MDVALAVIGTRSALALLRAAFCGARRFDDLVEAGQDIGARVLLRQVRTGDGQPHHDPLRLAAALRDAFDGFLGEVGRTEPWLA